MHEMKQKSTADFYNFIYVFCVYPKESFLDFFVGYIHNFFDSELSGWPAHSGHVFSIHELFL